MTIALAAPTATIDLRSIAPRERHALILARFAALQPGQALELVSDDEPQPLRVQFEDRAPGAPSRADPLPGGCASAGARPSQGRTPAIPAVPAAPAAADRPELQSAKARQALPNADAWREVTDKRAELER